MRSQFTSYEQLPITLTADHVAAALGISRANAYILLRSDGFPTLHIGKRMVVPKDRFLQWITDSIHPVDIYRIGQDDPAKLRGWKKYVFPIYTAYNGKCRKDALPMKF